MPKKIKWPEYPKSHEKPEEQNWPIWPEVPEWWKWTERRTAENGVNDQNGLNDQKRPDLPKGQSGMKDQNVQKG